MDPVGVSLELFDRDGRLLRADRVTEFPVTLGRAASCQVVLDDPEVSAEHARIEVSEDGQLALVDAGSTNGIRREGSNEREPRIPIDSPTGIVLGTTVVRIRSLSEPLAATLVSLAPLTPSLERRGTPYALALVFAALQATREVATHYTVVDPGDVAMGVASGGLVAMAWAVAWAILGWSINRRARFRSQIAAALVFGSLLWCQLWAAPFLSFNVSPSLVKVAGIGTCACLVAWLVSRSLRLATDWTPRRAWLVGGGAVAALFAFFTLIDATSRPEFSERLPYPTVLQPATFRLAPTVSPGAFLESSAALRAEVDQLAKEK